MTLIDSNVDDDDDENDDSDGYDYYSHLDSFSDIHFKIAQSSKTVVNEETLGKKLLEKLKKNLDMSWNKGSKAKKFAAFVQLPKNEQQKFLSYAFALTLRGRIDQSFCAYTSAGLLANVDVATIWRPTYENYFKRVDMATLDKIGKHLFEKAWKSAKNKRKDAKFIAEAVSNPEKASNGDDELLKRLKSYLPSGMAFEAPTIESHGKLKKVS